MLSRIQIAGILQKQEIIQNLMPTGQVISELLGYRGSYPRFQVALPAASPDKRFEGGKSKP